MNKPEEKFYPVDVSGNINNYATIFNINYKKEFRENHMYKNASNKEKIKLFKVINDRVEEIKISKKNIEVYYLECLEILNLNTWNKCFAYNNENNEVRINYEYFSDICCDIQKCFKGTLNYSGESFTNQGLIPGDFETYYFQYMAYKMFGSSLAFYGFQNLSKIKNEISTIPKKFINQLQSKNFLNILKNKINEDGNIFEKGNVLEFSIYMKEPKIKILSDNDNMIREYNKIEKKYKIGNSIWNIYFILM